VVGRDESGEPEQREMFAAGRFELAGGAEAMKVTLQPDFEEQARARKADGPRRRWA